MAREVEAIQVGYQAFEHIAIAWFAGHALALARVLTNPFLMDGAGQRDLEEGAAVHRPGLYGRNCDL